VGAGSGGGSGGSVATRCLASSLLGVGTGRLGRMHEVRKDFRSDLAVEGLYYPWRSHMPTLGYLPETDCRATATH